MIYRNLGITDLTASALGFGVIRGGRETGAAIDAALALGCNFFCTAGTLPGSDAERTLGESLRAAGRLSDVIIASTIKVAALRTDLAEAQIDAILRCLGRDRLDICSLQSCDELADFAVEDLDIFATMERLKKSGKVRYCSIAPRTNGLAAAWILSGKAPILDIDYNLFSLLAPKTSAENIFAYAMQRKVGLVVRAPLAKGYLSSRYDGKTDFPNAGVGHDLPEFEQSLRVRLAQSLRFLERPGVTLAQAALRFLLDEPAIASAVVGIRTHAQAIENFGAVDLPSFAKLAGSPSEPLPPLAAKLRTEASSTLTASLKAVGIADTAILAHVSGPKGVGKTFLMNRLRRHVRQITVLDIDALEYHVSRRLGLQPNWRNSADGAATLVDVYAAVQQFLDRIVARCKRQYNCVIIFGIHLESELAYAIPTSNRILLCRAMPDVVNARLRRDTTLESQIAKNSGFSLTKLAIDVVKRRYECETLQMISLLRAAGYADMTVDDAFMLLTHLIDCAHQFKRRRISTSEKN